METSMPTLATLPFWSHTSNAHKNFWLLLSVEAKDCYDVHATHNYIHPPLHTHSHTNINTYNMYQDFHTHTQKQNKKPWIKVT